MRFAEAFKRFVPFALALTAVFAAVLLVSQQTVRQSGNDPQIQLAEDAAALVRGGGMPEMLSLPAVPVDVGLSLSPWMALYDNTGKPLKYSALLHDAPPDPPKGLFDDSTWTWEKVHDFNGMKEMRVTWEDEHGSRQALVLIHVPMPQDVFIVAGRNMREIEDRTASFTHIILLGFLISIVAVFAALLVLA